MAVMEREQDLYAPVKALLEAQGYEVKGEVGAADVVGIRGGAFRSACSIRRLRDWRYQMRCTSLYRAPPAKWRAELSKTILHFAAV